MNEVPNLLFFLCLDLRENVMKELGVLKKILFKNPSHHTHH